MSAGPAASGPENLPPSIDVGAILSLSDSSVTSTNLPSVGPQSVTTLFESAANSGNDILDASQIELDPTLITESGDSGIQTVDLSGGGADLLILDIADILAMTDARNTLFVEGDTADAVAGDLSGAAITATDQGNGTTRYTDPMGATNLTLIIDNEVDQSGLVL